LGIEKKFRACKHKEDFPMARTMIAIIFGMLLIVGCRDREEAIEPKVDQSRVIEESAESEAETGIPAEVKPRVGTRTVRKRKRPGKIEGSHLN
jgi:hypothetical protein